MHVEHFMTKNPVACDASDSLRHVSALMRDRGVGAVVVLRTGKVAGIVTDRQVGLALADGHDASTPVTEVMTENPATLTLDDNIFSAVDSLRSAGVVRRLPVVNANHELLGVVSIGDIAVVAKDLIDAVVLDEMHNAVSEVKMLTGAKRLGDRIRRPTKESRLPPDQEVRPVLAPTPTGPPPASGGAGEPVREEAWRAASVAEVPRSRGRMTAFTRVESEEDWRGRRGRYGREEEEPRRYRWFWER